MYNDLLVYAQFKGYWSLSQNTCIILTVMYHKTHRNKTVILFIQYVFTLFENCSVLMSEDINNYVHQCPFPLKYIHHCIKMYLTNFLFVNKMLLSQRLLLTKDPSTECCGLKSI